MCVGLSAEFAIEFAELEMTNVDVVGEGEGLVNATNSFLWARTIARELALLETNFSI